MADDNKRGLGSDNVSQEEREEIARKGGEATAETQDSDFYSEIGSEGGRAAQESGNAHELTDEERSRGGQQ